MEEELSVTDGDGDATDIVIEAIEFDPGFAEITVSGGAEVNVEVEAPAEIVTAESKAVADTGLVAEVESTTEALDIPEFLVERGYGIAIEADADPAPATATDDQTITTGAEGVGELSLREQLIEQGTIRPAPEDSGAEAGVAAAEGALRPSPSDEEYERWQGLRAELEAKDDEFKAKQAAEAKAGEPEAKQPKRRQRLGTGAQKAGSGLRKAASGIGTGLRNAAKGLRKAAPKATTTPPATTPRPKAQTSGPKAQPRATSKAAGPSKAQNLGKTLGNLAGAPQRAANGLRSIADSMRQTLPKSQPSTATGSKPKASTPTAKPVSDGQGRTAQSLGGSVGRALGLPQRIADAGRQALQSAKAAFPKKQATTAPKTGVERPKAAGSDPTTPSKPAPKGGGRSGGLGGLGISVPKLNLGQTTTLVLLVAAVGFLTAGGVARTAQAVGGMKTTPLLVIAAFLFAGTFLLAIFRR